MKIRIKHYLNKHPNNIIWVVLVFCFLPANFAYAYIDAGTGSYIVQVVIGVFLGAAYAVKHYWRQIIAWIKNHKK